MFSLERFKHFHGNKNHSDVMTIAITACVHENSEKVQPEVFRKSSNFH